MIFANDAFTPSTSFSATHAIPSLSFASIVIPTLVSVRKGTKSTPPHSVPIYSPSPPSTITSHVMYLSGRPHPTRVHGPPPPPAPHITPSFKVAHHPRARWPCHVASRRCTAFARLRRDSAEPFLRAPLRGDPCPARAPRTRLPPAPARWGREPVRKCAGFARVSSEVRLAVRRRDTRLVSWRMEKA